MKIMISGTICENDEKWIYDWLEMDATCPRDVNDLLESAGGTPVDIYINSGGGAVFAGSEIYAAIRAYPGTVKIHVTGWAASAASVIACAAESDISPTGMIMVHNVSGGARGDYRVMDKESEILQKANEAIAAAYMEKTGMRKEEALELMDKETWLTAQDAVDIGLIDEIAGSSMVQLVASGGDVIPRRIINTLKVKLKGSADESAFSFEKEKINLLKLKGEIKNGV